MTSTKQNPPAKHHHIPEFLLSQWAVNDGKLWRFRPVHGGKFSAKLLAPAATGYLPDLYATPGLPAEHAQQVEQKFMAPLDGAAALALDHLLLAEPKQMSPNQRSGWSRFVMSLWFRAPDDVVAIKAAMKALLAKGDHALNEKYLAQRPADWPDSLEAAASMLGSDFADQAAMHVFRQSIDNKERGEHLNNMVWNVVEVVQNEEFLMSDAPVRIFGGMKESSFYVAMPISPRKLFIATNTETLAATIATLDGEEIVARANRSVVGRARLFVAATDKSQSTFIEGHFGIEEKPSLMKSLADGYAASLADKYERKFGGSAPYFQEQASVGSDFKLSALSPECHT